MFVDLNYIAILVITVIAFVIGMLWYGPLFGKQWMKLVGLSKNDMKGPMAPHILGGLVSTFIMMIVVAYVISMTDTSLWWEGSFQGLVLAIGLIVTVLFGSVNWEKRPVKLFLINSFYWLVSLAIAGGVYVAWPA